MKKKQLFLFYLLTLSFSVFSQETEILLDSIYKPDPHYYEDQMYFGLSYIVLKDLPENVSQNGFSNSLKFGIIRDIPINEQRNLGFGVGLGYSRDIYFHNLKIYVEEQTGEVLFQSLEGVDYKTNSFTVRKLDFPLEFRWRGSTPTKFKFWRMYTGVTISYVLNSESQFVTDKANIIYKGLKISKPWRFGYTLAVGYGLWNFSLYYGLNNIIKEEIQYNHSPIKMRDFHLGVIYYFL
jgi:hypothetical protein